MFFSILFRVFNKEQVRTLHLATRMAKFKICEFEEGDLASRGVRWQKWTALLEDNCNGRYKTQVTGHCFTNTASIPNTKANLRPNKFLFRPN